MLDGWHTARAKGLDLEIELIDFRYRKNIEIELHCLLPLSL